MSGETPNLKHQITNRFEVQDLNDRNVATVRREPFGILSFGLVWDFEFGASCSSALECPSLLRCHSRVYQAIPSKTQTVAYFSRSACFSSSRVV